MPVPYNLGDVQGSVGTGIRPGKCLPGYHSYLSVLQDNGMSLY